VREIAQVNDTIRQASINACALRIAHLELVHRYYTNVGWSLGHEIAPQKRPRRIPVHAQQRQAWGI
jgi:hypothetical protein